jgi:hypothetical protein
MNISLLPSDILNKIFINVLSVSHCQIYNNIVRQIIKNEDIELLKYMLNNVDIKELEKKFIRNIGPFEGIEYNSLLITALKQNKIKSFSLINNYFPDNNQLFLINYVFEKRTNKNKTLDWIINNPNNNTIEKMKQRETNFKEYMDDNFFRKKLGI